MRKAEITSQTIAALTVGFSGIATVEDLQQKEQGKEGGIEVMGGSEFRRLYPKSKAGYEPFHI